MIWLIGIRKNVCIDIREKFALSSKTQIFALNQLKKRFEEVVIINTCNRTEIYFNGSLNLQEQLKEIFEILGWEESLMEYTFIAQEQQVFKHLFETICGFHSKIFGEDQILGQVRDAYELSLENNCLHSKLLRLFQDAISCGKRFRRESKLYEIPVSSASIAISKVIEKGAKSLMVIGYGNVGKLVVKYALGTDLNDIYIVVRNRAKVDTINDDRIKVIDFNHMRELINNVDSVISCTASPHLLIHKKDINEEGNKLIMIDLAIPRDIDINISQYKRIKLYDIDIISKLDNENKNLRISRMYKYKYIIDEYLNNYVEWLEIRNVSDYIKLIKTRGDEIAQERIISFKHKSKDNKDNELAETLINSTSNYYVNRAIKLLKEEKLKGREQECMKILEKIFL